MSKHEMETSATTVPQADASGQFDIPSAVPESGPAAEDSGLVLSGECAGPRRLTDRECALLAYGALKAVGGISCREMLAILAESLNVVPRAEPSK